MFLEIYSRATRTDDGFFHRLDLESGEIEFVANGDLVGLKSTAHGLTHARGLLQQILIALKQSTEALTDFHFLIALLRQLFTAS